jgi:hypothetical protein
MTPRSHVLGVLALGLPAIGCGPRSPSPGSGQHGVLAGDLDRAADPCTDFYEFSNGTWRKDNPIPASMERWSRRWQAGETAKERLKEILDGWRPGRLRPRAASSSRSATSTAAADEARIDRAALSRCARCSPRSPRPRPRRDPEADLALPRAPDRRAVRVQRPVRPHADRRGRWSPPVASASGSRLLRRAGAAVRRVAREASATSPRCSCSRDDASARRRRDRDGDGDPARGGRSTNVALRDPTATDHRMAIAEVQRLTPSFD